MGICGVGYEIEGTKAEEINCTIEIDRNKLKDTMRLMDEAAEYMGDELDALRKERNKYKQAIVDAIESIKDGNGHEVEQDLSIALEVKE